MSVKKKAVFNWSGGKDSALALQKILQDDAFEIVSLLTTITQETQTSSIHAIPLNLLQKQAEHIGIPLYAVELTKDITNYELGMKKAVEHFKNQGVQHFVFGDIFLEDVKAYREEKLNPLGIEVIEPLWGKSSEEVMGDFLRSGIKTKIIVTQADQLGEEFIGKEITQDLLKVLPQEVDVCGENGEYHTFAYDGPIFTSEIPFEITEVKKISYTFKLDSGETKDCTYWQAILKEK